MLSEPGATNQAHLLIPQDLSRSLDLLKSLPVAESTEKDRLEPVLDVLAAWNGDGGRIDLVVDWMEWLDKVRHYISLRAVIPHNSILDPPRV
jgi:hypothetical protein